MSCIHCYIAEILEVSRPPDPDLVDLIEQAFFEEQTDWETMAQACYWLEANEVPAMARQGYLCHNSDDYG